MAKALAATAPALCVVRYGRLDSNRRPPAPKACSGGDGKRLCPHDLRGHADLVWPLLWPLHWADRGGLAAWGGEAVARERCTRGSSLRDRIVVNT